MEPLPKFQYHEFDKSVMLDGDYIGVASIASTVDTRTVFHYSCVMKNVTITLPEKVAQWARVWAARHNSSVSRLVGRLLENKMREESRYETSMEAYLSRKPVLLKKSGGYPSRDQLYER